MDALASAAVRIEGLPAVAYSDWCQQAASRLAPLPLVLGASVLITRMRGEEPHAIDLDAVGVASGATGSGADALSESETLGALSRIDSVAGAGRLTINALAKGVMGLWGMPEEPLTLTAWSEIGETRRALIVHLAIGQASDDEIRKLISAIDALVPHLARKCAMALGDSAGPPNWLTNKEQIVLEHLILGQSVREIADVLARSPHTVHDHVKSLHRKLGATSRGALIARALGKCDERHRIRVTAHRARLSTDTAGHEPRAEFSVEPKPAPFRAAPLESR